MVLYTHGLGARGMDALEVFQKQDVQVEQVQEHVMKAASDTKTPQGILAVLTNKQLEIPTPLDFVLLADGIKDPGNLGTILRSAAAAGVQAVMLPPGVVEPFSPKVIRAGMGAHFRLPIQSLPWPEIETRLTGLDVWLAASRGALPYTDVDWNRSLALIIGGEAHGASPPALALAQDRVRIPMARGVESLNVGVAAGVLLFEIARQRRAAGRS